MKICYQNLTLRSAEKSDAPLLCGWWNDGKVMAHAGFPFGVGTTVEDVEARIAAINDDNQVLIIEVDGKPAGEMSYRRVGDAAEIGIKICDETQQNKGYGTKLLQMFITALFAKGFERIILDTNYKNTRAQHVYEKLGFQKVRIRHNAWNDQLGQPQTAVDYELKKADFTPLDVVLDI